ncbi:MAG: phosphatidate cytidylyltransferase [Anaerolineales bacterium]|nr:phosphatidate cytidylyltransferase [Anaerolineales bacterium]MCX7609373.1 phosphatidate cytidylyltransferase [Anaerolineales bacterium]MDW8226733.1 phosphatidate cytidylyltransferase [Anaerolineales bacterium]
MLKRVLAALGLALLGIPAIILGGIYFFLLVSALLALAAWEFAHIFQRAGYKGNAYLIIGGTLLIVLSRAFLPNLAPTILTFSVLAAMTWHMIDYERGRDQAGADFAITTTGLLYIGWIGAYLIDLRSLENGMWWFFLVLGSVWMADSSAYFVGIRFGKHRLSPRLSPKKSWEGYWGGVIAGTLGSAFLAVLFAALRGPLLPWWKAAALGATLSILTTLGDLGESMLKRQAGLKDSGKFLPGHGGALDRIDSWLWGGALGYAFLLWFIL